MFSGTVLFPPSFVCKSCGRIRGGKSGTAAPLVFGTPLVGSVGRVGRCGGLRDFYGLPMRFSVLLPKRNKQHSTSRRKKVVKKKKKKPKTWLSVARENLVYTGSRKGDLLTVLSLTLTPGVTFPGCRSPNVTTLYFVRQPPTVTRLFLNTIPSDELRKFPIRRPIALSLLQTPLVHRSLSLAPHSLLSRQPLIFES
ncbi:hypothetical protein Zmor_013522 [Zophobas morio]|uniref:Uncharacterized protein n=1 Tax=Zophobas morio TaxID=2755281 RepID=A0AA38IHS0_9CUCU|nr:hypothetical protein Zmor_013522 [Zophobas morio]